MENKRRKDPDVIKKRKEFQEWIIQQDTSNFVFVDESHINMSDTNRKYGYSPMGMPAINRENTICNKSHSILSAICATGKGYFQLAEHSQRTATDSNSFLKFMKSLAKTVPRGSTIVLDNASIHKTKELTRYYTAFEAILGVKVRFLPPYSPRFNPIELLFNTLKIRCKSYPELKNLNYERFGKAIIQLSYNISSTEIKNYFHHAQECWHNDDP